MAFSGNGVFGSVGHEWGIRSFNIMTLVTTQKWSIRQDSRLDWRERDSSLWNHLLQVEGQIDRRTNRDSLIATGVLD
jgi:hypothetical protein